MRTFVFLALVAHFLVAAAFAGGALAPRDLRRLGPTYAGKHALVTGGSSGIGLAMAEQLAQLGAHVTILARDPNKLVDAVRRLETWRVSPTQRFEAHAVDIADRAHLRRTLDTLTANAPPVDVLVNNAGMSHPALTEALTDDVVDRLIATNLTAPVDITRYFLGRFRERGTGRIGFVASLAGSINIAGYSVYGATKAAIVAFADTIRHELSATNVAVSVVLPPDVATPMLEAENRIKPEVTKALSGSGPAMAPETVSLALLEGMRVRRFRVLPGAEAKFVDWMVRVLPRCSQAVVDRATRKYWER